MPEIFQNFLSGTLSVAPGPSGTTLDSTAFANMATVSSFAGEDDPDFMLLTLDPGGTTGTPELVRVTAHAASATSCTVIRAQQGTTARAHPSGTTWANVFTAGTMTNFQATGVPGRNLLHNGAFAVAQKRGLNAGTGIIVPQYGEAFWSDRWYFYPLDASNVVARVTSVSTINQLGSAFQVSTSPGAATPDASERGYIQQAIEGVNFMTPFWSSGSRRPVTLSFWCRVSGSDFTGIVELEVPSGDVISASYSVLEDVWTKVVITFPEYNTSEVVFDNSTALIVRFWLSAGSNYSSGGTLSTTWAAPSDSRAVGQTNLWAGTTGKFIISHVQLEAGTVATPFERLTYGQDLANCQRYAYYPFHNVADGESPLLGVGWWSSTFNTKVAVPLPTTMRATPVLSGNEFGDLNAANWTVGDGVNSNTCTNSPSVDFSFSSPNSVHVNGRTDTSVAFVTQSPGYIRRNAGSANPGFLANI